MDEIEKVPICLDQNILYEVSSIRNIRAYNNTFSERGWRNAGTNCGILTIGLLFALYIRQGSKFNINFRRRIIYVLYLDALTYTRDVSFSFDLESTYSVMSTR